jgi:hypothetical protein
VEDDDDDESTAEGDDDEAGEAEPEPDAQDGRRMVREAVQDWAERAGQAAKLVPYPRNDTDPRVRDAFARKVTARARDLVRRLVLPGEWYLVRWGGTRKGAGTFYTRPQLAGPIVRRTLAPLCFDEPEMGQDPKPRKPEQILALRVCDPAMGSGSFLVSALRYVTDALLQSLYIHGRLEQHGERWYIRLADGLPLDDPSQESLPAPKDDDNLDDILRARLKRHVVERCLYGVDLDALAVELARAALWVETMDYQLPFGFLDHKLKCGNSLIGGWLDRFEEYPLLAWDRGAGDDAHTNFVHHFRDDTGKRTGDPWTTALRAHRNDRILRQSRSLRARKEAEQLGQTVTSFAALGKAVHVVLAEAFAVFEELHAIIPIFEAERRAEVYKEKVLGNPALRALRDALNESCATWFWPIPSLEDAPTPENFLDAGANKSAKTREVTRKMAFFHWEIEFPDVFARERVGFDAVVMNPPWETIRREPTEFFSNVDPLYRTYSKSETDGVERRLFADSAQNEGDWIEYCAEIDNLTNWFSHCGTTTTHPDPERPFVHQGGGRPYTFRLFLELAISICHADGAIGAVMPSAVFSDKGSAEIRRTLLDKCSWEVLVDFENTEKIFNIHRSSRFTVAVVRKGGPTETILTAFMRRSVNFLEPAKLVRRCSDNGRP